MYLAIHEVYSTILAMSILAMRMEVMKTNNTFWLPTRFVLPKESGKEKLQNLFIPEPNWIIFA